MKTPNAMKRVGMIVVILALFLLGCTTKVQTLLYDKPVPENQSVILIIPDGYTVMGFDEEIVNWTGSPGGFFAFNNAAAIKVPAGTHRITYKYYWYYPGMTTYEQQGNVRIKKTTHPRTVSFDGDLVVNMTTGNRYIFIEREIVIDTSANDRYDQLP